MSEEKTIEKKNIIKNKIPEEKGESILNSIIKKESDIETFQAAKADSPRNKSKKK